MTQYRNTLSPPQFPYPWAAEWGEDIYGLWQAFTYNGIRCAFRWIEPGTFMMGSPEDEPERYASEEILHEVTLTQGFWLAETTVTQALWQSIMCENPSHFQGDKVNGADSAQRPVENVSWNQAGPFIAQLNQLLATAFNEPTSLRLPTEAEWEYACRAGTTTPFYFGENITADQVNFDGNYPYNGAKKGIYRQQTVVVKTLPPNPWGLYEMHGNVWEWCADGYQEDLGSDAVTDPQDPQEGAERVLRGGSWGNDGRGVRSAIRYADSPDGRSYSVGLRLALG